MTSQRLRAYKPGKRIYARARQRLDPMVHVATSARDVRGALEAGCPVIRLRRPGHGLDPSGPRPTFEVGAVSELPRLLDQLG
jgi:2-haloacid dehalogenase